MLLSDGEQGELRLEVNKLLNDDFLHVAPSLFHRLAECLFQFSIVMDIALAVTAGRHQRLHDTRETNFVGSTLELVEGLGVEIFRRAQTELARGQVADGPTVHGVVDGTGRRHHLDTLLLKLKQALSTNGLNLGYNNVRLVLIDHSLQCIAVEHGKDLSLVGHLHGRGIIVAVAGNDILASTHGGYHKLLAQFS